jgi:hypothetical protein
MSLRNLTLANVRRYAEVEPYIRTARIYAEERPTYDQWSKDATELVKHWATDTDGNGNLHPDRDAPKLDDTPAYKLEFPDYGGARVWVNVCCCDETEYNQTLSAARKEAAYILTNRMRWKDFTTKSEIDRKQIGEVVPEAMRDILFRFNR